MNLWYHGPIVVPSGDHPPGIYWLRLYAGHQNHVAVLTEVPGNPSWSVSNGIQLICDWIVQEHGIPLDRLILFEIYPRGCDGQRHASITRIDSADEPRPASRREIESLIGSRLPKLPPHADLYARVLRLGGGTRRISYRTLYEIIPTRDLPPPQDLFRCPHHHRFHRRKVASPKLANSWDVVRTADRITCPYHAGNWKAIAEESVRVLRAAPHADQAELVELVTQTNLPPDDLEPLRSLFIDPIRILNDEYNILNSAYDTGQHRSCAIRFSGATEVVISPGGQKLEEKLDDWEYRGGG